MITSNIIIGHSYVQSNEKYQKEIQIKSEIIKNKQKEIIANGSIFTQKLAKKDDKIHVLTEDMNIAKNALSKMESKLIKSEKENKKLKKELQKRKEVSKVFEITAYTAGYESTQKRKGEKGYGVTASGTTVKEGRTIACPPSMKFGTKVDIEGIGIRTCEDRGGVITEGHIDLYIESVNAALEFGRQKISVKILN